ncbi:MAG: hypothetical protein H7239_15835 [Flavobacterium sp.]|nr:hypothetical protein [Flavobacterium sp.]
MKKNIYLLLILVVCSSYSQDLSFKKDFDKSSKRSDYKTYVSKDSVVFKINDVIKIGMPSKVTFKHIFIFQSLGYLPMSVTENYLLDGECKIISISIAGTKSKGFIPYIQIRNQKGMFFSIDIENAISSREITTGLTENEVLEILKKEKEKLELGIITQEQFEKRKAELIKKNN